MWCLGTTSPNLAAALTPLTFFCCVPCAVPQHSEHPSWLFLGRPVEAACPRPWNNLALRVQDAGLLV